MENFPQRIESLPYIMNSEALTPEYFIGHYAEFLPRYISKGRPSADTMRDYCCNIDLFIRWCAEHKQHPLAMTDYQIRIYRNYLNNKNYHPSTIAIKIASIRAFFTTAHKLNLVKENPCLDINTPSVFTHDELFQYFSIEQMQEICQVFDDDDNLFLRYRNTLILYLMGVEGLRNVEVHRANVEDINWEAQAIMVRGKGHNDPIYPCPETFEVLEKYLQHCPEKIKKDGMLTPLIVSDSHKNVAGRISRNGLRFIMNKALEAVNLKHPGISCHVFRHSCGTNLYQSTKDIRVVQETLRQKDPKITARYAHVHERISHRVTSALAIHPIDKK